MRARLADTLLRSISEGVTPFVGSELPFREWAVKHFSENLFQGFGAHHEWLFHFLEDFHLRRGSRANILAPRGSAKSTLATLIYVTRMAVEGREPYIVIISDTATQAFIHLDAVKDALEFNYSIRDAYPLSSGRGPVWKEGKIRLKNGTLIEAFGKGGKIRGRRQGADRPSLIVIDDPQNDENIESDVQREKDERWLNRAVLKAGTEGVTNILMLGTAIHRDCLVLRKKRSPGWLTKSFRAIESWPDNMHFWKEWEDIYCNILDRWHAKKARRFYRRNKAAMIAGAEVLWPARAGLYNLMVERANDGEQAFASERQNQPIPSGSVEFPIKYFGDWCWVDAFPSEDCIAIRTNALDPSKGKSSKRGDYSAIVELARDHDGLLYVRADIQRRDVSEIVTAFVNSCEYFEPHASAVEINVFQELLATEIEKASDAAGVYAPIVGITNTVNKAVRIRRLGPLLSRRLFRFVRSPGTKMLVEQLQEFPCADHDDGPDALEMALRVMIDAWNAEQDDSPLVMELA